MHQTPPPSNGSDCEWMGARRECLRVHRSSSPGDGEGEAGEIGGGGGAGVKSPKTNLPGHRSAAGNTKSANMAAGAKVGGYAK